MNYQRPATGSRLTTDGRCQCKVVARGRYFSVMLWPSSQMVPRIGGYTVNALRLALIFRPISPAGSAMPVRQRRLINVVACFDAGKIA